MSGTVRNLRHLYNFAWVFVMLLLLEIVDRIEMAWQEATK